MKTKMLLLSASLLMGVGVCYAVPPADQTNTKVQVVFDHPEKFTDVRHSSSRVDKDDGYLIIIKEHLERRAPRYLEEGQTLTITFTDIDMAGDFEPWRGPDFQDVRIVKDIYPPRLSFSFKVTDASGATVKEGTEKLVELGFQIHGSAVDAQDALRYEKGMLDNWLRDKLGPRKKTDTKK